MGKALAIDQHRLTIAIWSWVSMWASMIGVFSSLSLKNYLCDDIGHSLPDDFNPPLN